MGKKNSKNKATSYLRYSDFRPYWNENTKIDYPYREVQKNQEVVSLKADTLDTLFDLIPNVPINQIEVYDYPLSNKDDASFRAKVERAVGIVDHRSVLLYTSDGIFAVDRYKQSVDISVFKPDQLEAFKAKSISERAIANEQIKISYKIAESTYYSYPEYLVKTARSDKTMYDVINLLKLKNGAIVSKPYDYYFNNCITNSNCLFKALKTKKASKFNLQEKK